MLTTRAQNFAHKCDCQWLAPRCEFHHCDKPAVATMIVPISWRPPALGPKFFCRQCWYHFVDAWNAPATWKGLTPPENAPDDWRPSLMDHLRHAQIAMRFEERRSRPVQERPSRNFMEEYWLWYERHRGFTPAQIANFRQMRALRDAKQPEGK